MPLDKVDERLVIELGANARVSYTTLARDLGMTVNAVKKRVAKLKEQGILLGFSVAINMGLCYDGKSVNFLLGWVSTDGTEEEDRFIEQIGNFPSVYIVFKTARDTYGVVATVPGFEGLSELVRFLEGLQGVTQVDTDALLDLGEPAGFAGPKFSNPHYTYDYTFSNPDLRVLRCLKEDPRMSISKIAKETGLTAKRVRKILDEFHEHRVVVVSTDFDFVSAGFMGAILRINLDLNVRSPEEFRDWVFKQFPWEWFGTYSLVDRPSIIIQFLAAEQIHTIEEIAKKVKSAPAVRTVDTLILYRPHTFHGMAQSRVDELLKDAGL